MAAQRRWFDPRRWVDTTGWLAPRSRLTIAMRMVLGVVIAIVGLWVGASRSPFGYALVVVGGFMVLLFWRVGVSARRERERQRELR